MASEVKYVGLKIELNSAERQSRLCQFWHQEPATGGHMQQLAVLVATQLLRNHAVERS